MKKFETKLIEDIRKRLDVVYEIIKDVDNKQEQVSMRRGPAVEQT